MLDYLVDHLGMIVWVFLVVIASIDLAGKKSNRALKGVLLGVGVVGILLDSALLFMGFFMRFREGWMFDVLGLVVFPYIIFIAYKDLKNKDIKRFLWTKWVLMIMGVGGLFADLFEIGRAHV